MNGSDSTELLLCAKSLAAAGFAQDRLTFAVMPSPVTIIKPGGIKLNY